MTIKEYQNETGHSVHNEENQRILGQLVKNEVGQNVSMLITQFLQNPDALSGSDYEYDEILDVARRIDYEEAVFEIVRDMNRDEVVEYLEDRGFDVSEEEELADLREAVEKDILTENIDYQQEFVEDQGADITDFEQEALEFWTVSKFFARKLAENNEAVLEDFFGLTIWGRTTSGQAILLDGVIAEIAIDTEILKGQKYEWNI